MKKGLNTMAAALTAGGLAGVILFVWTLVAASNGYGEGILMLVGEVYPWYEISTQGAFLGLLWAFLDGFIGVYLVVWVYRWLNGMLTK